MSIERMFDSLFPISGCKVLVALSGGKDSVYLLHRLLDLARSRELTVGAAHLNHQLRDGESDRDEAFVRNLCRDWDVPLTVGHCDVRSYAAQHRMGIEEAARELRYAFLEGARQDGGYDLIATAHQANDQAETMLLNLIRGAGSRGLAGIPPKRENIVRPLLDTTGEEITDYLESHGIPYVEDSSNESDTFARNRLRHHVLPVLTALNPRFISHAASAAQSLREDDACLQNIAEAFLRRFYRDGAFPVREFLAISRPIRTRVLRTLCGPALTRRQIEAIMEICMGTERKHIDVSGQRVTYDQGRLFFSPQETASIPIIPMEGAQGSCVAGHYRISWEIRRETDQIHNSLNTFCLKCENIEKVVLIGPRQDGDAFRPVGRHCTKTLKTLFQERHLTAAQRAGTPVLRDGNGVAAVPGFGMDERFLPEIGDTVLHVLCEEYKEIGG